MSRPAPATAQRLARGLVAWSLAWAVLLVFDERMELANKALLLVLSSAVAGLWWPAWVALPAGAAAIGAFNYAFVPPRGTFAVDLHHDAVLLATMLAVSWIVALLMARLRRVAAHERDHALRAEQLRELGDALRAADDPADQGPQLLQALARATQAEVTVQLAAGAPGLEARTIGRPPDDEEDAALRLCLADGRALGPGSGRHEAMGALVLPLRGRAGTFGAALLRLPAEPGERGERHAPARAQAQAHLQALCDQMGSALERVQALRHAAAAREAAHAQALRNTLLASISHDHRTPLATILGAAGSLQEQGERLSAAQRRRLADTIVDEATQLARLTENTLQLARLESGAPVLRADWESLEEIVGSVLARTRRRHPGQRFKVHLDKGLPLVRCDAVLIVQLLDNLVDNALRYGADTAAVEISARLQADALVLAVADRGPGVSAGDRERIFTAFERGPAAGGTPGDARRRGVGVGLALCRAIAAAHGGHMTVRPRRQGGSRFELHLPLQLAPPGPDDAAPAGPAP